MNEERTGVRSVNHMSEVIPIVESVHPADAISEDVIANTNEFAAPAEAAVKGHMRPQKRDFASTGKPVVPEGMSKNEYKRLKRQEARTEYRQVRKEQEKEEKRQRRLDRLSALSASSASSTTADTLGSNTYGKDISSAPVESNESGEQLTTGNTSVVAPKRKAQRKEELEEMCKTNFEVVIDCDWEQDHADRPLQSLGKQILICHGLNKKSERPCFIHLCGVGPRLSTQLQKVSYASWRGVKVHSEDYCSIGLQKELVYLTSDGEETLTTLDPNCAYIIGGIVDRNRLKGATYNKAIKQGIRTAKLPIKEYCVLHATPVLTVNHVFEILLAFARTGSWLQSFESILPQRKGVEAKAAALGGSEGNNVVMTNAGDDEDEEDGICGSGEAP